MVPSGCEVTRIGWFPSTCLGAVRRFPGRRSRSATSWGLRSFSNSFGHQRLTGRRDLVDLGESKTSSFPSWRRRVTAVAVSLAIRPVRIRPSVVWTVKLAYFASRARFGSRIATSKPRAICRSRPPRSGPTSAPSWPSRWQVAQTFLNKTAPLAAFAGSKVVAVW